MGCAKSLWARRNIATDLPSTSSGGGFCELPQPQRACWLLSPLFRLAKDWGTDEGKCLWVLSRAKAECSLCILYVGGTAGPSGEFLCCGAIDTPVSRPLK